MLGYKIIEISNSNYIGLSLLNQFLIKLYYLLSISGVLGERIPEEKLRYMLELFRQRGKAFSVAGGLLNHLPWSRFILPEISGYSLITKINQEINEVIEVSLIVLLDAQCNYTFFLPKMILQILLFHLNKLFIISNAKIATPESWESYFTTIQAGTHKPWQRIRDF